MAGVIDYQALREQAMGSGMDEEAVTVNTRALIDKVLARYSGEWTTLRELIQNAADAQATKVTIRFETLPSRSVPTPSSVDQSTQLRHILLNHTLSRLLVTNNGEPFGANDWSRLKRIAEGNPDETKIGAFGVGFYSVFADCETPFVSSGKESMVFYWKGNSLFTRKGRLPDDHSTSETCFMLDYRNTTSPVPKLLSLCQFLSTSLTFVGLESIELWLDQWNLLTLTKKAAPGANVKLPGDVNPKTKEGLMKIVGVEHQSAQIDAKWNNIVGWTPVTGAQQSQHGVGSGEESGSSTQSLRSFFSRLTTGSSHITTAAKKAAQEEEAAQRAIAEDLGGISQATVFLRISTVNIQTYVAKSLAQELERATKKPPPKHTRIAILTSSYDETSASLSTISGSSSKKAAEIFSSVLPTKNGRVYIGFPTAQTTGLLAHISAPSVIPTVERESIDLNARYVRTWNVEMLRVAGIACRIAYASEMAELKDKLARAVSASGNSKVSKENLEKVIPAAVHVFKQYTYQESTPSSQVGQIIEEAFWTCNQKASIDILSTRGVLASNDVRLATEDLSFVEGIPVVPDVVMKEAKAFIGKLQEFNLVSDITTSDIKRELEAQALNEHQIIEFLTWAGAKISSGQLDGAVIQSLFDGTVATISEEHFGSLQRNVLLLGDVKTFLNVSKIPSELPTPHYTIPFRLTRNIPRAQLEAFGWEELQIVPWLRHLIEMSGGQARSADQSLTTNPTFAAQILPVLSKAWDSLSQSSKATMTELLTPRTVIPTKLGMRKPQEAYFASVKLFDDLPVITGLQGVKEKFLAALGVRKTVELTVVFERLLARSTSLEKMSESKWSHVDLIRYLVSVRNDIPSEDITRLRNTAICPAEERSDVKQGTNKLYKVSELFEPKGELRALGLPILHWPGLYVPSSAEARFLTFLGLRPFPSVPELVGIMAKAAVTDPTLYDFALTYFIANHYNNGYAKFDIRSAQTPFLPLQGQGLPKLVTPRNCYTHETASILGFQILRRDLHPHATKFGVVEDPPIADCANVLTHNPPQTRGVAKNIFGYFAGRLNEIGSGGNLAEALGSASIVPVTTSASVSGYTSEKPQKVRHVAPKTCFLGDTQTYGEIFDFVDFGPEANSFLLKIGSKHEPNSVELAQMVVSEPARLLKTLGTDKYQNLLRRLAENSSGLKADKALWKDLKQSPCLLAYREVSTSAQKQVPNDDDEYDDEKPAIREYLLATASQTILVDDIVSYRVFKDDLLAAPQEETIENFYSSLGAPWLSSLVQSDIRKGQILHDQTPAHTLRKLLIERSRLFLHDHDSDAVRRDSRWLEANLKVQTTATLSNRRTLQGYKAIFTTKLTAALEITGKKEATLFIVARYDLYEVSKALVNLLLKRPKPQDVLALEMILGTALPRLRAKGYNVDRILRQQAAESRIAENARQRELEEERKRTVEQEKAGATSQIQKTPKGKMNGTPNVDKTPTVPRAFAPDSPEESPRPNPLTLAQRAKKPNFSWQSLINSVGLDNRNPFSQQQADNLLTIGPNTGDQSSDHPPPYNPVDPRNPKQPGNQAETVTAPQQLQQNLVSAVQACRSHDSSSIFSKPQTNVIKEGPSYCDSQPGRDISFAADSGPGIKVFLANALSDKTAFLSANAAGLNAFASLLRDCGSIFPMPPQSLHIFYDQHGSTIAFNSNGSLFCNYRFFTQLHWAQWQNEEIKAEAAVYWWVVLCHELAHNLVKEHSADHSYYTESFVMQYFPKMVAKAAQYQAMSASSVTVEPAQPIVPQSEPQVVEEPEQPTAEKQPEPVRSTTHMPSPSISHERARSMMLDRHLPASHTVHESNSTAQPIPTSHEPKPEPSTPTLQPSVVPVSHTSAPHPHPPPLHTAEASRGHGAEETRNAAESSPSTPILHGTMLLATGRPKA